MDVILRNEMVERVKPGMLGLGERGCPQCSVGSNDYSIRVFEV